MSAIHDPKINQLLQGNPNAQAISAAAMAHVNEHLGFAYRQQIEQQLGMQLPPMHDESGEDMPMDPEVEVRLAPMLAQAAQQLLQQNQAQAAQQQAQQQAQDPMVQLQQQELQLKGRDIAIKEQKLKVDAAAKADQLQVERERIASQERVAGAQIGAKVQNDKANLAAQQHMEGSRLGVDVAKHHSTLQNQSRQQPTKGKE